MDETNKTPDQREQPVFVKKGVLYSAVAGVGIFAFLVLLGLHTLNKDISPANNDKGAKIKRLADDRDTDWYRGKAVAHTQTPPSKPGVNTKSSNTLPQIIAPQHDIDQDNKAAEALDKAMKAPISTQQISVESLDSQPSHNEGSHYSDTNTTDGSGLSPNSDQNMQSEKKAFLKTNSDSSTTDHLDSTLQTPLTPYALQAGTLIPAVLMTGINADLPGQITAQIRSHMYDSIAGKYLLIPQGAKIMGLYDSQIAYGQERVLIAWKRIIFPNGQSIDLEGMPGVDISGYAGFHDQVNNHYAKVFGSVILMSLLSAGAQLSQPQNQNTNIFTANNPTVGQTVAQSLGTNISTTATALTQKNINIQPTLEIRPGYAFNISVTKDMVFPGPYAG